MQRELTGVVRLSQKLVSMVNERAARVNHCRKRWWLCQRRTTLNLRTEFGVLGEQIVRRFSISEDKWPSKWIKKPHYHSSCMLLLANFRRMIVTSFISLSAKAKYWSTKQSTGSPASCIDREKMTFCYIMEQVREIHVSRLVHLIHFREILVEYWLCQWLRQVWSGRSTRSMHFAQKWFPQWWKRSGARD